MAKCQQNGQIDAYLLNRLPEEEIAAFEDHYFNCPRCFEEIRARAELISTIKTRGQQIFGADADSAPAAVPWSKKMLAFFTPRQWAAAGLAAAALFILLVSGVFHRPPAPPQFVLDDEVVRGEMIALLAPVIDIKAAPQVFEWRALDGAAQYKVSLFDDKALIWSTATSTNRVVVPEEVRQMMQPQKRYSWQVKAFSAQGALVSLSSKVHFTILPAP